MKIATAKNRKSKHWKVEEIAWLDFIHKLSKPAESAETYEEYLKLTKDEQAELKDVGGYVGGYVEGERKKANLEYRTLLTLDLDNLAENGESEIIEKVKNFDYNFIIHSTRKHSKQAPRMRLIFPFNRKVSPEEYEPIARKIAELIKFEAFDPTTFDVNRLMYFPSISKGAEYIFEYGGTKDLDPDDILEYYLDWRDIGEWKRHGSEKQIHQRAKEQQDPREKEGLIGLFCRSYSISRVIEDYLADVYIPNQDGRYTYTKGTTTGGAVVYDDVFLYSYHSTDPACETLCNSFDLLRIHKHNGSEKETLKFISNISTLKDEIRTENIRKKYEEAKKEFDIIDDFDDDWTSLLKVHPETLQILRTRENVITILEHDQNLKGAFKYDEFSNRLLIDKDIPWRKLDNMYFSTWEDIDDIMLRCYLESVYNLECKDRINDAVNAVYQKNTINVVKNYIDPLVWDGIKRLETLLIDYLGAEDSEYTRAVTTKMFVGAISRIYRPGIKFDTVLTIRGDQGIGKSTLLRKLGKRWFSDSMQVFEGKEASEQLQGNWIIEIGELTGLRKSEVDAVKQFLSKQDDKFREAYGRRVRTFPRRCVFFGTTNEYEFLKDKTGNRRFWVVDTGYTEPIKNVFTDLDGEVDQIWAEAKHYFDKGCTTYLNQNIEILAEEVRQEFEEANPKEGIIEEFVNRMIPINYEDLDINQRKMYWEFEQNSENTQLKERKEVCIAEIWCELFGKDKSNITRKDSLEIGSILRKLGWKSSRKSARTSKAYGVQKQFVKESRNR